MRTRIAGGCLFRTFRPQLAKAIKTKIAPEFIENSGVIFSLFLFKKLSEEVNYF